MRVADLFAGAGGFSEGAKQAGARVVWAGNHWPVAVETHAANNPDTLHACENLRLTDWSGVPEHELMVCSPSCKGSTKSRGKEKPHHDIERTSALAIVDAVDYHRPPFVLVENVEEMRTWVGFEPWKEMLRAYGYKLVEHLFDSADFGVPQSRPRLFILASRNGLALKSPALPHRPASSFVDLQGGRWRPVEHPRRAVPTLGRVRKSREKFGDRFLLYYNGSATQGRALDRPIGTITTVARWAVVDGDRMRMLTLDEIREAMGFPPGYRFPDKTCTTVRGKKLSPLEAAIHLMGNAVAPPVARELVRQIQAAA